MMTWMKAVLGLALLASWLIPVNARAEDHPFKKAEVGDWVSYKSATAMEGLPGGGMNMETKQTVTAKTEKEVTMKYETIMNGNTVNSMEIKIPLDVPYDPVKAPDPDTKVEKVAEGNESITVAGKTYACKWYQTKVHIEKNGMKMDMESKSWICPDVPLGGMVKSESNMPANKMKVNMELTGAGKK